MVLAVSLDLAADTAWAVGIAPTTGGAMVFDLSLVKAGWKTLRLALTAGMIWGRRPFDVRRL